MNTDSVEFTDVPGYYAVSSSRDLGTFIEPDILKQEMIGFDNLVLGENAGEDLIAEVPAFRQGLYRQRAGSGLYQLKKNTIKIINTIIHTISPITPP